jgi:DNA-binding MarR family transcriptional regulator
MTNEIKEKIKHWRDAVPNDRFAHLVRDVSRAFTRSLTIKLEKYGIPFGHWTYLRVLWEADGLIQKELSKRAGVMEPTTFIALKLMETQGYIIRKKLPQNKKNVYIYLTDKGKELKSELVPLAIESNNSGAEGISAENINITRKTLLAMLENLAREEQILTEPVKHLSEAISAIHPAVSDPKNLHVKSRKGRHSIRKGH